jgi:membrane-bound ClpP family serine protease
VPEAPGLGWKFAVAELLLIPAAMSYAIYLWPKTPLAKRIFLKPPNAEELSTTSERPRLDHLIGEFGRALTPLRPSGSVDFEGRRIDAMSEDGLIASGSMVKAVRVHSGVLIVRRLDEDALKSFDVG